jgi:hypothetical protein
MHAPVMSYQSRTPLFESAMNLVVLRRDGLANSLERFGHATHDGSPRHICAMEV